MTDFIAALAPNRFNNWEICKRTGLWGIPKAGHNGLSNGRRVLAGDRVFIWKGQQPNGFIAVIETLGPMSPPDSPAVEIPWDEPQTFGGVFPMKVIDELGDPINDDFTSPGKVGKRFGFNSMALRHNFTRVTPEVAIRISQIFPSADAMHRLGVPYTPSPPPTSSTFVQPFEVDPDVIDRGIAGHYHTVEALVNWVRSRGCVPLLPRAGEPRYDLAWIEDDVINVAEIKSTTAENREMQLRLGLGQVLRYREALSNRGGRVKAWLVAEEIVLDPSWRATCDEVKVELTWPAKLSGSSRAHVT